MSGKTGILLVGALGYVAACVIIGVSCLKRGICSTHGLVTELDDFRHVSLPDPADFVMGGWDVRSGSPRETARLLFAGFPASFIDADVVEGVADIPIYPGCVHNCGKAVAELAENGSIMETLTLMETVDLLRQDIRQFKSDHDLETVVVVNLASTEPPLQFSPYHATALAFEECLKANRTGEVRASMLYSWAAITESCPYLNFTPSQAALIPALVDLAEKKAMPIMGNDGKTGETLVKSALAPLFRYRNLEVLSWESVNMLGNMDGKVLDDPANKESKLLTKEKVLPKILKYEPHSRVHIYHVPSLDDQKTAWNFIHFRGFLGAKMSLQFIWQGYDSFLAAPLVIDLVRLIAYAAQRNQGGLQPHLASFFKNPLGVEEHRLSEQFTMLKDYLHSEGATP